MNWKPVFCGVCLGLSVLCSHHDPHVHESLYRPAVVKSQVYQMATSSAVIGATLPSNVTIIFGTMGPSTST